jgi:NAD(P)-dependent dehydrogenase (short-subunit alcohol dehydrogenase family)
MTSSAAQHKAIDASQQKGVGVVGEALRGKTIVVVGQGGGIGRAVTVVARSEGARVVVAGRDQARLAAAYQDPGIDAEAVDVTDDSSIAALARRVGLVDHVVSAVSARARGRLDALERASLLKSFDTKVIGPLMLAKHFATQINQGGSFVLFSGFPAFKIDVGFLGVAITDGAVDFLTRSLAVELAPIRVNAISPGVIDSGAWDSLGEQAKRDHFQNVSCTNLAQRIGTAEEVADAALFAMTNTFVTGVTLKVDGGQHLT